MSPGVGVGRKGNVPLIGYTSVSPPLQKTGAGSAVKVLQRHAPAIGISVLEVLGYTAGPGMQIFK